MNNDEIKIIEYSMKQMKAIIDDSKNYSKREILRILNQVYNNIDSALKIEGRNLK